jgi:hypothetical protein
MRLRRQRKWLKRKAAGSNMEYTNYFIQVKKEKKYVSAVLGGCKSSYTTNIYQAKRYMNRALANKDVKLHLNDGKHIVSEHIYVSETGEII